MSVKVKLSATVLILILTSGVSCNGPVPTGGPPTYFRAIVTFTGPHDNDGGAFRFLEVPSKTPSESVERYSSQSDKSALVMFWLNVYINGITKSPGNANSVVSLQISHDNRANWLNVTDEYYEWLTRNETNLADGGQTPPLLCLIFSEPGTYMVDARVGLESGDVVYADEAAVIIVTP